MKYFLPATMTGNPLSTQKITAIHTQTFVKITNQFSGCQVGTWQAITAINAKTFAPPYTALENLDAVKNLPNLL